MKEPAKKRMSTSTLGLILFALGILAEGVVLEVALPDNTPPLAIGAFPLIAAVGLLAYVLAVFLPQRHEARRARDTEEFYVSQCAALQDALDDLRKGDLVRTVGDRLSMSPEFKKRVGAAVRALDGLIRQIQLSSVEVATAAQSILDTSSELAAGGSEQAAAVIEITATMEELARTAAQIASNASNQAQLAGRAAASGNEGAAAVDAALGGMEVVQERMQVIASRTEALGKRSREIYGILDLINEIAQETHILALNAAIEATAAGDSGERFGVVAEEVRRLAERSKESVGSVRTLLDDFSSSLRSAVIATEEGGKAATQALKQTAAAAQAIEQLRDALTETADASREISQATQEQQTASDQVVLTVKDVGEVIQRASQGLKELSGAADQLSQVALSIQLLTQAFRIASPRSLKHVLLGWAERLQGFTIHGEVVDGVLKELVTACPYVELAYVVDRRGAMVGFRINKELIAERELPDEIGIGKVYADRPWFQGVSHGLESIVTPVYSSLLTDERCFTVATSIPDAGSGFDGILGVDINVRHWTHI
ncbi:MAG: hypothetical protein GXP48_11730 [Acidobacteria bacterium]|nr:hypothetical protein [Acidobacteriota bacterium]